MLLNLEEMASDLTKDQKLREFSQSVTLPLIPGSGGTSGPLISTLWA